MVVVVGGSVVVVVGGAVEPTEGRGASVGLPLHAPISTARVRRSVGRLRVIERLIGRGCSGERYPESGLSENAQERKRSNGSSSMPASSSASSTLGASSARS